VLNAETKRHIDAARDVLVGVAPNPMTQVDQITYALIYKFMDDMDQSAIKLGGEPSFFEGDLEPYAYSRLMDPRLGNQERMNLYGEALAKFAEAKQLPELFRTIFRAAFLPYRSPETLGLFLKEINFFDYSHPEELGNAYEYLLSVMSAQGDAGQFRTPRHIIDFMVDVMDPSKDERVLDPACGTGGFLVSSYKHILKKHDGKEDPTSHEERLTPDERRKLMDNFEGYDIDPSMVRIAQVNMYLHLFKSPKVYQYDTLTSDDRWNDKFDVILANPPFMSPKGGIKPHQRFAVTSKRSEVLFVDYILQHLRPTGRAAVIVPEGIVFKKGAVYQALRRSLIQHGLRAVVSLPKGIFSPYSGFKTDILMVEPALATRVEEIMFVNVRFDGFDPGATKRPIADNDLPEALRALNAWRRGEKTSSPIVAYAKSEDILSDRDIALSVSTHFKKEAKNSSTWPTVPLGSLIRMQFGTRITKKNNSGTRYPVFGGGDESFRTDDFNRSDEYVISRFAMSENCVRFVSGDFWMLDSGGTFDIRPECSDKVMKEYIGQLLLQMQDEVYECSRGGGQRNLDTEQFSAIEIPLPPMEVQKQILLDLTALRSEIAEANHLVRLSEEKIHDFVEGLWS
jgi:type I restriction enzyme M protein